MNVAPRAHPTRRITLRRKLWLLAALAPASVVALVGAAIALESAQRREAAAVAACTTMLAAAHDLKAHTEDAHRALAAAADARDTGIRFVPRYLQARTAIDDGLRTVQASLRAAPELADPADAVDAKLAEADRAAERVLAFVREGRRDDAGIAAYDFQAGIAGAHDAAGALMIAARRAIPGRLAGLHAEADRHLRWLLAAGVALLALAVAAGLWIVQSIGSGREGPRPPGGVAGDLARSLRSKPASSLR